MDISEINRARRETPGCEQVIHFNNAGAALMPNCVINGLIDYIKLEGEIGGYEAAVLSVDKLQNIYQAGAKFLNCKADELAFTESATRAWDMAFYSIPFQKGDVILTGMSEYESNYLAFLQMARKNQVEIKVIPNDESGQISLKLLEQMLDKKVKLIAITNVPTNGGLINPAAEIGKIAKNAGVYYLLDACQAAGQIQLDVQNLHCDFLSFTGRKYCRGPRGTGMLYVKSSVCEQLEPPFIDLEAAEWISKDQYTLSPGAKRFEQWEFNHADKIGLGIALDYVLSFGMDIIEQRVMKLGKILRKELSRINGIQIQDLGDNQGGIVSFTHDKLDPAIIQKKLFEQKINISVSPRRYTRLDMDQRNLDAVCRASVHYYNTEDEIQLFVKAISYIT